jgi:hypothetical protein
MHVAEALGAAAEGSYEQEAAAVEEDEETEREDERRVATRPDPNEVDVPESAELALDGVEEEAVHRSPTEHTPSSNAKSMGHRLCSLGGQCWQHCCVQCWQHCCGQI